jgi:hypothetical protein
MNPTYTISIPNPYSIEDIYVDLDNLAFLEHDSSAGEYGGRSCRQEFYYWSIDGTISYDRSLFSEEELVNIDAYIDQHKGEILAGMIAQMESKTRVHHMNHNYSRKQTA